MFEHHLIKKSFTDGVKKLPTKNDIEKATTAWGSSVGTHTERTARSNKGSERFDTTSQDYKFNAKPRPSLHGTPASKRVDKASAVMNVLGHSNKQPGTKPLPGGEKAFEPSVKKIKKEEPEEDEKKESEEEEVEKGSPKVAPRTTRVSQTSRKKGESPGTNLGLVTSRGKSVFGVDKAQVDLAKAMCPIVKGLNKLVKNFSIHSPGVSKPHREFGRRSIANEYNRSMKEVSRPDRGQHRKSERFENGET